MPAVYSAEEIFEITSGRLAHGMMPDEIGPVVCDTRLPLEGAWFAALTGAQFDGHDFLGDAFACGAIGCIVEERTSYAIGSPQFPLIAVTDPLLAVADLARNWRRRINPRVIAIAAGATRLAALAECIGRMLHKVRETIVIGAGDPRPEAVFSAILDMDEETRAVVASVTPEDIEALELLTATLRPDVIVLLSESYSHLKLQTSDKSAQQAIQIMTKHLTKGRGVAAIGALELQQKQILEAASPKWRSIADEKLEISDAGEGVQEMKITLDGTVIQARFRDCDSEEVWSSLVVCQAVGLTDNELSRCFDAVIEL